VLQDLVRGQTDERAKAIYEVYFIHINMTNASTVETEFKGFLPRIELGTNNAVFTSNGLVDKVSQRPAKMFSVKMKSQSGNFAIVFAQCYIGPEGVVNFEYKLKWDGTNWIIVGRKRGMIS
jgi:hypothetical protein